VLELVPALALEPEPVLELALEPELRSRQKSRHSPLKSLTRLEKAFSFFPS